MRVEHIMFWKVCGKVLVEHVEATYDFIALTGESLSFLKHTHPFLMHSSCLCAAIRSLS